ncbi:TonB-dependent receptor [Parabacteroides sp. PF5-9]|uniref:TonB-dependent receptor n=1 Tax=Parabacteroides sp. PF5-9 TaxID=1742404 RepID=UPI0024754689|nr:TonB-dependent receptor [Parabacteroides sp. PF5-9]MDH6356695.1 outer membrane receptor for ferrienterochelin and colicin [Parabacteroides sp. PF5-9]
MISNRLLLLMFGLLFVTIHLLAQEKRFTISGSIKDQSNGEDLIGASILVKGSRTGVVTNAYGLYSLNLPSGRYTLIYSYIGYGSKEVAVDLYADTRQHVQLALASKALSEVVVSAEGRNANVSKIEMSTEKLSVKTIKAIPALMGEVDVIKAIQLLPGVQSTSEGSSGFSVRGGGHDQNLILLDEATVYNASHLMGFFSVFNNDAIKEVTLYKGDIPATFGGRLSSLLDIRSKDGNNQQFSGAGGIGLISSRLTLEGPIGSDKASFLISGRRTYADLFLKLASDKDIRDSGLYFYDMNAKLNFRINDNNRIYLAGYLGEDRFSTRFAGMNFGNKALTLRWNHIFSPKLFSNFSLVSSIYDYYLKLDLNSQIRQDWKSQMQDYGFKMDFSYHPHPAHTLKFGINSMYHNFIPGKGGGLGEEAVVERFSMPRQYALESAVYLSNESSIGDKLKLKYGLRFSLFQNITNGEELDFLEDYEVAYTKNYDKGKIYHHQSQFEPRLGAVFMFNDENSVKASYSRTAQYIQLASNSASGSPLDIWFQASQNVKPQLCDQFAFGYFRNFADNGYEASAEVYYKDMQNVIDFKDHAELMGNEDLEHEVRFGKGYAYGLELMLRKNSGPLTGWVSYTLSKSRRKADDINEGAWYRSPYDKPHNISVVATYELSRKWSVSANWVYSTGMPVTYPTGRYQIEDNYVPIYSGRNEYRYPDYHRLDLSATLQLSKPGKRFRNELNFSLYNAYGRKNPWTISFMEDEDQPGVMYGEMVYLFSFIPSITWNFNF